MSEQKEEDFGNAVGKHIGQLFTLCIFQAKATMHLVNAIKKDSGVSEETKFHIEESVHSLEKIVEMLNRALPDMENPTVSEFIGIADE